jgi:hypothetical protein
VLHGEPALVVVKLLERRKVWVRILPDIESSHLQFFSFFKSFELVSHRRDLRDSHFKGMTVGSPAGCSVIFPGLEVPFGERPPVLSRIEKSTGATFLDHHRVGSVLDNESRKGSELIEAKFSDLDQSFVIRIPPFVSRSPSGIKQLLDLSPVFSRNGGLPCPHRSNHLSDPTHSAIDK